MQKKRPLPKPVLPGIRIALSENLAFGSKQTLVEMQKTTAQAFGQCYGALPIAHKRFIARIYVANGGKRGRFLFAQNFPIF